MKIINLLKHPFSTCLYMFLLLSVMLFTSGCEMEKNINMPEIDNNSELVEIPIDPLSIPEDVRLFFIFSVPEEFKPYGFFLRYQKFQRDDDLIYTATYFNSKSSKNGYKLSIIYNSTNKTIEPVIIENNKLSKNDGNILQKYVDPNSNNLLDYPIMFFRVFEYSGYSGAFVDFYQHIDPQTPRVYDSQDTSKWGVNANLNDCNFSNKASSIIWHGNDIKISGTSLYFYYLFPIILTKEKPTKYENPTDTTKYYYSWVAETKLLNSAHNIQNFAQIGLNDMVNYIYFDFNTTY